MTQSPLLIVGEWQKKSLEAFCQSQDRLISAINKGFNAMAAVLSKDTHPDEVQCALVYLNVERSLALQFDKTKDDSLRSLVYGLLESLRVSLIEWTDERNQRRAIGEISTQAENESALSLFGPLIPPCESLPMGNNLSNHLSINPPPSFPIEPKEETIDNHYALPHDYQISASELMSDKKMIKEEEMDNENMELVPPSNPNFLDLPPDLLDQGLNITRFLPLNSVVDPMDISQILPRDNQKRKSYKGEEESEDVIKKRRVLKTKETELECPECEFRTLSVLSWMGHLRKKHSTTPALVSIVYITQSGLALLCECGHESLSEEHSRKYPHGNTTVIRKRRGPIRRLDDDKVTPQCVLCEIYPKTARGYIAHLRTHHKSSLAANGIYIKCSCGVEVRYDNSIEHLDECDPRQFSLHKLNDELTR